MVLHPEYRPEYKEWAFSKARLLKAEQTALQKAWHTTKIVEQKWPTAKKFEFEETTKEAEAKAATTSTEKKGKPKRHIYTITAEETTKVPIKCPCPSHYCRNDMYIFYCECPSCGCMEQYTLPGHCIHCQVNCDEKNSTF
jgi:hypothetical protein